MKKLNIKFSAATMGGSREMNQDVFLVNNVVSDADTTEKQYFEGVCSTSGELCVFIVCDGVGAFKKSGFAAYAALLKIRELVEEYNKFFKSQITQTETEEKNTEVSLDKIDSIVDATKETTIKEKIDLKAWVLFALEEAKKAMLDFCRKSCCNGASSTIAMLVMREDEYVFANIGDSPCYLRDGQGEIRELSFKHNLASYKRIMNVEWQESDERVLLYHLGDKKNEIVLTANILNGTINPNDAFIVCTDGVAATLGTEIIKNKLSERTPSYKFVSEAAKVQDADNCTAITVYVEKSDSENSSVSEETKVVG